MNAMRPPHDLPINESAYEWTGRFMRLLRRVLKVNIRLHDNAEGRVEAGEIFVFNHFARFETFIPQYLFWEQCRARCRSIADRDLFRGNERFATYLRGVGAVPNDHPHLLAYLTGEVMRGHKLIVFPEGGMVKDRRVLDEGGDYSVYSRSAQGRRKQHSGAAVIGIAVEVFKQAVLFAEERGEHHRLREWCDLLGIDDPSRLLARARQPTLIVPANITFYPMRVRGNPLLQGVELFNRGISPRLREELLIEGNILLRDTDMDIRLGTPLRPTNFWTDRETRLAATRALHLGTLADALDAPSGRSDRRMFANAEGLQAEPLRDAYMHAMYQLVTVHLSHLAALLIYELLDAGRTEIPEADFHRALYLAVKRLQAGDAVHLHRSLRNPDRYASLPDGRCTGLEEFVRIASSLALVEQAGGFYRFLPKLLADHTFDAIRLENPVEVYANEVAPVRAVLDAVTGALRDAPSLTPERLAELRFDDERRALAWDRERFRKPRHAAINALQTQSEDAAPFLLRPETPRPTGVLLVHGFLASPAETRAFGEALLRAGHTVLGVRLKGHGTSPWDLRTRTWHEWYESVHRGFATLAPLVDRVALVGFSTGGALCLHLAADRPPALAGVAAIAAPMRFRNRNMAFVPLVHRANRVLAVVREQGVMAFRPNPSENPHINYQHMPIRALYELRRAVESLQPRLPLVRCPALIVQGDDDPVVDPGSAALIHDALGSTDRQRVMVPSRRHGILYGDVGGTWKTVGEFIDRLDAARSGSRSS